MSRGGWRGHVKSVSGTGVLTHFVLFLVELGVPLGEVAEAFAEGDLRAEAVVALKGGGVGIGGGDVTGLHGDELFVSVEVEVLGEDAGTDELFLEDGDEVEEVLGLAATDVIHGIGWDGEAVVAFLALGGALHHAYDAFYDVIDIGKVATAVAVVVDLRTGGDRSASRGGVRVQVELLSSA